MSTKLAITLKKLREKRNLTIMALSEISGVGNGTIGNIERGENKGRVETLEKLSTALNLSSEERRELFSCIVPDDVKLSKDKFSKDKLSVVELDCKIPVYSKVFAGENGVLEFGELIEYINIPSLRNGTEIIGIKVDGDSMERTIPQGATILVKKDVEVSDNEIGVFIHNNNPLVKRFRKKENEAYLISDNNNYMPIAIREGDEFYIVGKVVEYLCKL